MGPGDLSSKSPAARRDAGEDPGQGGRGGVTVRAGARTRRARADRRRSGGRRAEQGQLGVKEGGARLTARRAERQGDAVRGVPFGPGVLSTSMPAGQLTGPGLMRTK